MLDQYDEARLKERIRENIITVVEPANEPESPAKPNKLMNIALGLFAGLVGGVGLAFLFEESRYPSLHFKTDRGCRRIKYDWKNPRITTKEVVSVMESQ